MILRMKCLPANQPPQIWGADFYEYFSPSFCPLRVYLKAQGLESEPPGPYADVLQRLGQRHERQHIEQFPDLYNLSALTTSERLTRTRQVIAEHQQILYHPLFHLPMTRVGLACDCWAEPDLLLPESGGYVIREIKLVRQVSEQLHPEVLCQLGYYGWLCEQITGTPPLRLEVCNAQGEIVRFAYDRGAFVLPVLEQLLSLRQADIAPISPVGWSKCGGCGFHDYCWSRALKSQDVALVSGVDQGLASALYAQGTHTFGQLANHWSPEQLAEFTRPWGKTQKRVGKLAQGIWQNAQALAQDREIILEQPQLPLSRNYVMFDLEGLPPQMDELQKIYLWGTQVFGENSGVYSGAVAGFGSQGDYEGYLAFLSHAQQIFRTFGDIPFVHWHHYEKTNLQMYLERYGDPNGIAERVLANLLDLLPITRKSVALPLPSYSLKVVEKYIGYQRSMEEYGGDWSMAKYIQAVELAAGDEREQIVQEILKYNREDLEATWAVFAWLRAKSV